MSEIDVNGYIQMVRLGDASSIEPEERQISSNKFASRLYAKARKNAKRDTCYLCGKPCSSFCNSHSIPRFTLKNIADNGKVFATLQKELPLLGKDTGVNKAGTFQLICRECDSSEFSDYENPDVYLDVPSDRMLAQIALKDYLRMLSRRMVEMEEYRLLGQRFPERKNFTDEKEFIAGYDLKDFQRGYEYARRALAKKKDNQYYLAYCSVLDYVVPFAAQSSIILIGDFEDQVINDIYNFSSDYRQESIHIAVFPLDRSSVVLVFAEQGKNRYRKFFKQFKKLSPDDQLAAINYILFAYTENIYLSPQIYDTVHENQQFMDTCKIVTDVHAPVMFTDPLPTAIRNFSLGNRKNIINLLSEEYAITRESGSKVE